MVKPFLGLRVAYASPIPSSFTACSHCNTLSAHAILVYDELEGQDAAPRRIARTIRVPALGFVRPEVANCVTTYSSRQQVS